MAEPCEPYGKAVDRAMWAEKAVAQFSKMFVKRKGEAVEGESSSAIWDVVTSNQGLVISAEKPDTDQRNALVEWYVIGVKCQDILRGFVLRREHLAHSSRKTKTDHQDDR
ncbi:hypothetical protein ACLOJK_027356 [Asimina triloba]